MSTKESVKEIQITMWKHFRQDPLTALVTGAFPKIPLLTGEREAVVRWEQNFLEFGNFDFRGKLDTLLQQLGNPGWGEVSFLFFLS